MLICDIDGVLLDLSAIEIEAYVAAISDRLGGVEVNTDWNSYAARNDIEVVREIFVRHRGRPPTRAEETDILDLYHHKLAICLETSDAAPVRIEAVIDAVARAAGRLRREIAVATANTQTAARMRLSAARLPFDWSIGAFAEDGRTKVEILAHALRQVPGRGPYLYLGDNLVDLEAALRANVPFLGIAKNVAREQDMRAAGARRVILRSAPADDILAMLLSLLSDAAS